MRESKRGRRELASCGPARWAACAPGSGRVKPGIAASSIPESGGGKRWRHAGARPGEADTRGQGAPRSGAGACPDPSPRSRPTRLQCQSQSVDAQEGLRHGVGAWRPEEAGGSAGVCCMVARARARGSHPTPARQHIAHGVCTGHALCSCGVEHVPGPKVERVFLPRVFVRGRESVCETTTTLSSLRRFSFSDLLPLAPNQATMHHPHLHHV